MGLQTFQKPLSKVYTLIHIRDPIIISGIFLKDFGRSEVTGDGLNSLWMHLLMHISTAAMVG